MRPVAKDHMVGIRCLLWQDQIRFHFPWTYCIGIELLQKKVYLPFLLKLLTSKGSWFTNIIKKLHESISITICSIRSYEYIEKGLITPHRLFTKYNGTVDYTIHRPTLSPICWSHSNPTDWTQSQSRLYIGGCILSTDPTSGLKFKTSNSSVEFKLE